MGVSDDKRNNQRYHRRGFTIDSDGKKLTVALIDETGKTVASGKLVSLELFNSACRAYQELWLEKGVLRNLAYPT